MVLRPNSSPPVAAQTYCAVCALQLLACNAPRCPICRLPIRLSRSRTGYYAAADVDQLRLLDIANPDVSGRRRASTALGGGGNLLGELLAGSGLTAPPGDRALALALTEGGAAGGDDGERSCTICLGGIAGEVSCAADRGQGKRWRRRPD